MKRHPVLLRRSASALLVVDIQERIVKAMYEPRKVIDTTLKLIAGFSALGVPVYVTEQYPKGLGETESRIRGALGGITAKQKMTFSCVGAETLFEELREASRTQIVVCGIEAHVCVQQTVLDLLANGFQVNLVADGVTSRNPADCATALRRMEKHGAEITTAESVLFELLEKSGTAEFKEISRIVK